MELIQVPFAYESDVLTIVLWISLDSKHVFFILYFSLALRATQLDYTNRNEINHDIHLADALYRLGNDMYLLVHFSFKANIANHQQEM